MTPRAGAVRPQRAVVAVVGSTGVGKSQLAVSLCNSLSKLPASSGLPTQGKVLSADSMQLYKGLDVITNKVTEEEKSGVQHWGLDVVQPGQGGSWDLGKWCNEADQEVRGLSVLLLTVQLERTPPSTLPVICGGTHYFIQHFLFPPERLSLERTESRDKDPLAIRWTPPGPCPPTPEDMDPELKVLLDTFWRNDAIFPVNHTEPRADSPRLTSRPVASTDHELLSMWKLLNAVDPNDAPRWHWRDERKVRRAIERWWERGGAELVKAVPTETVAKGGRHARCVGIPKLDAYHGRFRTLIFWVYEPLVNLRDRLDRRVDKMVDVSWRMKQL